MEKRTKISSNPESAISPPPPQPLPRGEGLRRGPLKEGLRLGLQGEGLRRGPRGEGLRHCRRGYTIFAAALFLCLFISPLSASAFDVIVIKETEIKPFRDAIEGFKSACGCTVAELELSDAYAIDKAAKARPDAIFVVGTRALRKASAVKDIPLVYTLVMPSEEADHEADNVSGVSMDVSPDVYLGAMTKLVPGVKRIGVLSDPEQTGPHVKEALVAARARGLTLVVRTITRPKEVTKALEAFRGKIDAFWLLPDPTVVTPASVHYLMLFSFQHNLPVFSFSQRYTDLGAVASLGVDPFDLGVQAAGLAKRLVRGEKGPLREHARGGRLSVNRKVADKMGLGIKGSDAASTEGKGGTK